MKSAAAAGAALFAATAACSGNEPIADDGGELGSGGTTTTSASTTTSSQGAGPGAQEWTVSFVAETLAGEAPAVVSFQNDSSGIISGVIGPTQFWQVGPSESVPTQLAVSADIPIDASIGFHESKDPVAPCAFLPVIIGGVLKLEDGQGYLYRVFDNADTFGGEVLDHDPPPPFVALRALLSRPLPFGSHIELSIGDSDIVIELLQDQQTLYGPPIEGDSLTIDAVTLHEAGGASHTSNTPVTLSGAFGFTIHIDREPAMDAIHSVDLETL